MMDLSVLEVMEVRMERLIDEDALRYDIEQYIEIWSGTSIGEDVRNMYENGSSLESICDYLGWEYSRYAEE